MDKEITKEDIYKQSYLVMTNINGVKITTNIKDEHHETLMNSFIILQGMFNEFIKQNITMNKEDYNIISPDNKVWNFHKWMGNPNMNNNDVSENPYPVMYVEGKPVWEGDRLLFNGDDAEPYQMMREVKWQHRGIINGNPEWIKLWSWKIKK